MGRNGRKVSRRRRGGRRTSQPSVEKGGTGRKAGWLWTVGLGALALILGWQPLFGDRETSSYTTEPDKPTVEVVEESSDLETAASTQWDFLKNGYKHPNQYDLRNKTIQLGSRIAVSNHDEITQALIYNQIPVALTLRKRGWGAKDVSVALTFTMGGTPTSEKFREPMVDYCQRAEAYLHESIDGLVCDRFEWIPLKSGDDYAEGFDGKAFIGESFYHLYTIEITNKETKETEKVEYELIIEGNRVNTFSNPDNDLKREEGTYIFIGRGFGTLSGPISELLPYCTADVGDTYEAEVGSTTSVQVAEAFSEGVSYVLTNELVDLLEIPNGHEHVENLTGNMNADFDDLGGKVYTYVPQGIEWVETNGVQAAHDLYIQDPGDFLETIQEPAE